MESSKKILANCDVLLLIFHYLDIKEHLKLIKICPQFEYAIVHGAWRLMYKNLNVLEKFPDTFILQFNAANGVMTECSLTYKEFHIIIHHSSMYIRKLELNDILYVKSLMSLKYHNLTELTLRDTNVEDAHLHQLAENCINLQSLCLINFADSYNDSDIRANSFGEMKALNKLEIADMHFLYWYYRDVQQLFCIAHLKILIIDIFISDNDGNNGNNEHSIDHVYNTENLRLGDLLLKPENVCFEKDFIRFKNLTKLTVGLNIKPIDDNFLRQLSNGCTTLCELCFTGCNFTFKTFPHMNNLKHLTFEWCGDKILEDLDKDFRKLKLKSLSLVGLSGIDTPDNVSDYNYISSTLETLNIESISDRNIVTTFFNRQHKFDNVSKIRLLELYYSRPPSLQLCFSHNFPYLQELIMDSYCISSEDILHLKHLKVLEFNLFDNMSWSYLEILFQHPTLTHITITPFHCRIFEKRHEHLPNGCEGFTTILEYLSLPSVVYESDLNFWPNFRQRNKLLKLKIVDSD